MYIKLHGEGYRLHSEVHGYDTRNKHKFIPAYRRLKRCQNGPTYWSIKLFNVLPENIKTLEVKKFKQTLKRVLVEKAFYNIDEFLKCDF